MAPYDPSHLEKHLSLEQRSSVQIHKLNQQGVRGKDNQRAIAQNELAKPKAACRRKPDKTVENFELRPRRRQLTMMKAGLILNSSSWILGTKSCLFSPSGRVKPLTH